MKDIKRSAVNEDKRKKIIIVGATGTAQKRTLPALDYNKFRVVAISGRREDELSKLCEKYGIDKFFTDENKMAEEFADADIAIIATPPFLHAENIRMLTEKTKALILCEKPLVSEKKDLEIIRKFCSQDRVYIAHHLRHQNCVSFLKDCINNRVFGDVKKVSCVWEFFLSLDAKNTKWKDNAFGVGAGLDVGIHCMDMMLCLFGLPERIEKEKEWERFCVQADHEEIKMFYKGFCADIRVSQSRPIKNNFLKIEFENAVLQADGFFSEKATENIKIFDRQGELLRKVLFENVNPYAREIEDLLEKKQENCTLKEQYELLKMYFEGDSRP